MNNQSFLLQSFPGTGQLLNIEIAGKIARNANKLAIEYTLVGDLAEIAIALPSATPSRKHQLWENTCFEFFLGMQNSPSYWEINLSPAGDWNVYRFDDYRQGMQEEKALIPLPFIVQQQGDSLPDFSRDLENLSPLRREALNSPATLVGLGAGGLGLELPFADEVKSQDSLRLNLDFDLDKIIPKEQALEVAITTVIKCRDGEVTYWALTHQGAEADFHRRDSFIMKL